MCKLRQRFFIGLHLDNTDRQAKKIASFSDRHSNKNKKNKDLYVSLTRPFELKRSELPLHINAFMDIIDDHMSGLTTHSLGLSGADVLANKYIYLNTVLSEELFYLKEELDSTIQNYVPNEKRKKTKDKSFVTLAKCYDQMQLNQVLGQCYEEFDFPMQLPIQHLALFTRVADQWIIHTKFVSFNGQQELFPFLATN